MCRPDLISLIRPDPDFADPTVNRLSRIDDGARTTTYGYDPNGNRLTNALPNGVVCVSGFDALNRVTQMMNAKGATNLYTVSYGYDLVGNRRSIIEDLPAQGVRTNSYGYDAQYRLTNEVSQSSVLSPQSFSYTYDLAGNRASMINTVGTNSTTTTYAYDALNQLGSSTDGTTLTHYYHDLNGNLTNKTVGATAMTYSHDVNDRLVSASSGGSTVFQATYDYRTRRLTKTEGLTTTYFRYDGGDSFQEVIGGTNAAIQVDFVRGSGLGGGIGSILYSDRSMAGGAVEHYAYNAVGSTVALTDTNGVPTKTDYYEAFGNITSSSGSSSNNRLANTKERDFSIGLDNHGFRYFDPEIGRYITRDPLGYKDGLDVYLYVHNNPINHIDPLGLEGKGRPYWEDKAYERLRLDRETFKLTPPILLNRRITAAYARLYRDRPDVFLFMGMAQFGSAEAGSAMVMAYKLEQVEALFDRDPISKDMFRSLRPLGFGRFKELRLELLDMMGTGNKEVFDDLFWHHLAWQEGGISEIKDLLKRREISEDLATGWFLIDAGTKKQKQSLIFKGNVMIFKHEQYDTLQLKAFGRYPEVTRWVSPWIKSPFPGGRPFSAAVPRGDIGIFADRWKWLEDFAVEDWLRFRDQKPEELRDITEKFADEDLWPHY